MLNEDPLEDHFFALRLTVATLDLKNLELLWSSNFSGLWSMNHLEKL